MPMRKLTTYGPSILVLLTAAIVLMAAPSAVHRITFAHTSARIDHASLRLAREDSILAQLNQAYRDIAAAVEPSVVHISAKRPALPIAGMRAPRMSISSGSGWIYDEHGHIVTNYHVIEDALEIDVQLHSGTIRSAEIVGFDPTTDIALLKIAPGRLHPAMRGDLRDEVRQGDLVFAFGSPFDFRFSMSSGVVSGKGRSVGVIRPQLGPRNSVGFENFIQTDAAINPGNSGGPLTDYRGRVIGMNTAIATATPRRHQDGRLDEGQFGGVGLAIPLDMIEPVVSQLIATGEVHKGFLGVSVLDRSDPIERELEVLDFRESGVAVARVHPNAAALHAHLRPGDVITHMDRAAVHSPEQLLARADSAEGETVELTIWRHDWERNRGARLRVNVEAAAAASLHDVSYVLYDEPIMRRLEQLGFIGHGVPIARTENPGPARSAGLRPFDVITHVNDQPIALVTQLQSVISSMLPGQSAKVRLWRYDAEIGLGSTLELTVPLARLDMLRAQGFVIPGGSSDLDALEPLGIARMSTATPERMRSLGQRHYPGVLIEEIVAGSKLDQLMPAGSIIVSVGDRPVRTIDEFREALGRTNIRLGAPIAFRDPDGNFRTGVLEVE